MTNVKEILLEIEQLEDDLLVYMQTKNTYESIVKIFLEGFQELKIVLSQEEIDLEKLSSRIYGPLRIMSEAPSFGEETEVGKAMWDLIRKLSVLYEEIRTSRE